MGEVVNLRVARKRKARAGAQQAAEANRLAFGRARSEREKTDMEKAIAERRIDGHLREGSETDTRDD